MGSTTTSSAWSTSTASARTSSSGPVHLDDDGNVVFAARATEMIKSGGTNIAPAEIEEFLRTHPDVVEAAVSGVDDEAMGQVAIVFVSVRDGAAIDERALREFCRKSIASFKVPARIAIIDGPLSTTSTGRSLA